MDYSLIFRIGGIGILVSVIYSILKQNGRDEIAYTVLLTGLAVTFFWTIQYLAVLFNTVKSVFNLY